MTRDSTALLVYRTLLWLYPTEFRDHFGAEVCRLAARRLGEETGIGAHVRICAGLVMDAPKEHYHVIRQDLIYALRTMRQQKLTTLTAIGVLALGIGSTTTIFSLVNGVMLRPLPYPDSERLVYVEEFGKKEQGLRAAIAYPNFLDFCARNRSLQDFALFGSGLSTLRGDHEAERVPAASGTGALFRVLGVQPLLGRVFNEEDDRPKAPPVVVLGENLWKRRYGGDVALVGHTIVVGSTETRVVGIMPAGFQFPDRAELWTPLQLTLQNNRRTDHSLEGVARLKAGTGVQQAQEDLRAIMSQISREHPTETYGQTVNLAPYRVRDSGRVKPLLFTLSGAVVFVLLIACANITNLLLVKASARTREIAVRGALGASRVRLVRQFVVESIVLGISGAAAGVLLAWCAVPAMVALVPQQMPRWIHFSPDFRVLLFVAAVTAGTGVVTGMIPALSVSRINVVEMLKESGRTSTAGSAKSGLRSALVAAEVAMSLLLLVGAALMMQTFRNLQHQETGYAVESIVTLQTAAPSTRYPTGPKAIELEMLLRKQLAALPGVLSVAGSTSVPLLDTWGRSFTAEGAPLLGLKDAPMVNHLVVTPGYFRTLGVPILEGREFDESDGAGPKVAIIDSGLAHRYWPSGSAVGKRVRFGPPEDNEPWHTVVGVVGESRNQRIRSLGRNSVYLPHREIPFASIAYLVRTGAGLADPGNSLRARVRQVDPSIAVSRLISMEDILAQSLWQERFFTVLFAGFAGAAVLLALAGLYGVLAYAVSRRTHEMGIRMALGASAAEIRRMVLLQSGKLIGIGLAVGTLGAIPLTRAIQSQLYGVSPTDPATFAAVAGLLAAAALLASYLPARKATRVDPMLALRQE